MECYLGQDIPAHKPLLAIKSRSIHTHAINLSGTSLIGTKRRRNTAFVKIFTLGTFLAGEAKWK